MTDNTFRIDPQTGKLSIGPAVNAGGTELTSGVPTGGSSVESPTRPETSTITVIYQGGSGDGSSLTSAAIVGDNLIVTYSNGDTENLGRVRGDDGADGTNGTNGTNGVDGVDGTDGTNGTNGKTILYGTVDPDGAIGTNGDFYINLTTTELWGPKGFPSAGWNNSVSLIGPAGNDGIDGTNGTNGTNGVDGADGADGVVPTYLNVAAVRAIDHTTLSPLDMIAVASNTNLDDFRAGLYSWVATSLVPDNGLTVIAPTSIGSDAGRFHAANFIPTDPPVLPAAATDSTTAIALVNAIRDALIAHNLAR